MMLNQLFCEVLTEVKYVSCLSNSIQLCWEWLKSLGTPIKDM